MRTVAAAADDSFVRPLLFLHRALLHQKRIDVTTKVKVRTLDIAPLRETPPQKRSGMARVLERSHSFICTPTRSSAIGMSHTCLSSTTEMRR